jgi:hypothetical protein
MKHNKIIKCPTRGTIRIEVRFDCYFDYRESRNVTVYQYTVWNIPKGKRKEAQNGCCVSVTEIQEAKNELWQMLKP